MNSLQLSGLVAAEAARDYAANPQSEELRQEARAAGMSHYRATHAARVAAGAPSYRQLNAVCAGSRAGELALRADPHISLVDLDRVRAAARAAALEAP